MQFGQLLASAGLAPPLRGRQVEIRDVQLDSRRCTGGSCFVAVRGAADDGHKYIPAALAAGASAVVCQDLSATDSAPALAVASDGQGDAAALAQALRGWPGRKLTCAAVTGTNGKTTVTYMIQSILAAAGCDAALLGTIRYETGSATRPAAMTTPGPIELAELTAEMVAAGRTHLVMEASSHALAQGRLAGLSFAAGVFTNLTGDHLDYHGDMDSYLAAKARLFEQLPRGARAIVNRDDPYGRDMAAASAARVSWYAVDSPADLWARMERMDADGSRFTLIADGQERPVQTAIIGRHNVQNCLAAVGACLALGVDLDDIVVALGRLPRVPGRLERVPVAASYSIFVDYAHTDDALQNVLTALRPITRGRVILVFGCGGDRDRTKRPRMAAVAEKLADVVIVTSDNPRGEPPEAIVKEILAGFSAKGRARAIVEIDRRAAIAAAIAEARASDVVLLAGKGHETYQIIGSQRLDFDDVKVATEVATVAAGGAP